MVIVIVIVIVIVMVIVTVIGMVMDYGYNLNGNPMDFEYGFDGKMVVGGEFIYGDSTYGLAVLDNPDSVTFWKMPNEKRLS